MQNKTSASLILQTIMVLIEKQNSTIDANSFPTTFYEDVELERCYGVYGCFSKAYPWTEHRPDNNFPDPPDNMCIRYPTFTRRNMNMPVHMKPDDNDQIRNANINPKGPFYIISHGFLDSGDKQWIQNMAKALLSLQGNDGATVFAVDWRRGSQPPYTQAVANIRLIGVITAHFVHNLCEVLGLTDLDNFHFIGHSLGAHLGGYFGHTMQTRFNMKLGRITGLDPAAPYFTNTVTLVRLDRSDAKYVDIIHSHAMPVYYGGLGMKDAIGHVDFYPNGGESQPGCEQSEGPTGGANADLHKWFTKSVGCSHQRSYELFTESVTPNCLFIAIQCDSFDSFLAGNCTSCDNKHFCLPIGYHSYTAYKNLQARGSSTNTNIALYALTGNNKPYCRVNYEITVKISNSSESRTHGPDVGRIAITLFDRHGNKSDHKFLDNEQRYYKPGDIEKKMVALKSTGHPPIAVTVEWKYETNLFNPLTWRVINSPSIFIEYVKVSSMEYNTVITVCPKQNKPVIANMPNVMKTKYCKFT